MKSIHQNLIALINDTLEPQSPNSYTLVDKNKIAFVPVKNISGPNIYLLLERTLAKLTGEKRHMLLHTLMFRNKLCLRSRILDLKSQKFN